MSWLTTQQASERCIEQALDEARRLGASSAEAALSVGEGLAVTVRMGEVETVEHQQTHSLAVTVYFGQRKGNASTSDLGTDSVRQSVAAACAIARHTAEDRCAGLVEPRFLAETIPDLDLWHPWGLKTEEAIQCALACESAARRQDARIRNSEGATVASSQGLRAYGNTHGFHGSYSATRHSLSCSVIAQDDSGMQRDYWYGVARDPAELETAESVGRCAAERALRRLGARALSTRRAPVLFAAEIAPTLLSHFVAAIRGSALYRRASFLVDQLGEVVFTPSVRIHEQPFLRKGLGSAPFDQQGVAPQARDLVEGGILRGYVLDGYAACKLGMKTTGNAGGVHNLAIEPGEKSFSELLMSLETGFLVTQLLGQGINLTTGDYSRGAAGFWVEDGQIQFPVEQVTIASNLRSMFQTLREVGTDLLVRGNIRSGSLLLGEMSIAGS